jgi:hypothetical protein
MPKSLSHLVALLLLAIFMAKLGAWGLSTAQLSHALAHAKHPVTAMTDHQHTHHPVSGDADSDADDADDVNMANVVEHKILHAIDHLQFFAQAGPHANSALVLVAIAPWHFTERALPHASLSPPFRPPRHTILS